MSGKDLINGIKTDSPSVWKRLFSSPASAMRAQIQPIMKDVRDVTFDDVFEEACIILMQNVKAGKLDGNEVNLEGYLYVLCKRIALKYAGRKQSLSFDSPNIQVREEGSEVKSGTPEEEADDMVRVDAFLDSVLQAMPENQRAILRCFYWEKMSMAEIASLFGLKNEAVAKSTKNRCMNNFKKIAGEMLKDDEMAETAIERTVERMALRGQLTECRQLGSGILAVSACKDGKTALSDADIISGIKENSPIAWKALYASVFDSLEKDFSCLPFFRAHIIK